LNDIEQIRAKGFGTSHHELIEGAVAVAAPFFNGANQVAGAVCIFGPSVRVNEQKVQQFAELLKRATTDLSRLLGHREG
jgi:DNA-binding IclR family transcriptional regulator